MAKPRLIIIIRHAQSEGNKNREIHQSIPDHRVKLTSDGWTQAYDAGRRLRKLLRADDKLHFFTSPYRRTRETTEGILATLTSDEQEPSPFKRSNITVHEEPRLREQDFGNFQPCSAEMERMWQERADYGHFFYRIPNGESAADAYDRVSGFNESLWRQFGDQDFASVCVLVTHGLMSRVFLMKWYHFTVEYFEDLRNVNHCEFLIMRKQEENGKYHLENKLRTWSELRHERALQNKEREDKESKDKDNNNNNDDDKAAVAETASKAVQVPPRRWGGCPNGCNHKSHYTRRDDLEALRQKDQTAAAIAVAPAAATNGHTSQSPSVSSLASRRPAGKLFQQGYNSDDDPHPEDQGDDRPHRSHVHAGSGRDPGRLAPQIDVTRAREEVVSSPDGTPSFISAEDRLRSQRSPHLHVGRDGGGTYSGHASLSNSDAEDHSEDDAHHRLYRGRGRGRERERGRAGQKDRIASLTTQLQKLPIGGGNDSENNADESENGDTSASAVNRRANGQQINVGGVGKGHVIGKWPVVSPGSEEATAEDEHLDARGMRPHAGANRLGDDHDYDGAVDDGYKGDVDDLAAAEKEDRSIQGSVY